VWEGVEVVGERTFDDVVGDLDRIVATCRDERSALGIFPAMYRTVTVTVGDGIDQGAFDQPERVRQMVTVFADLYIDAYDARRSGASPALAWALAFDVAERGRCSICQHLLLGMNAHINLDLGIATAAVSTVEDHDALRADFERVNDVLFALLDALQGAMGSVSPWMARLDRLGLGIDEALMRAGIARARSSAWDFSRELVRSDPARRPALVAERDVDARGFGRLLCARWSAFHAMNRVVALRECRDRQQVIDAMGSARIDVAAVLELAP
jgi:hypothetical protein